MENRLEHIDEFHRILATYQISEDGLATLKKTRLVLMLAPSSSGRNTIIKELVKTGEYQYLVTDTTRQPRVNDGVPEQNGREYWFRSEDQMLADLHAGKYLEAEIIHGQQVSGISIRELEKACKDQKIAITDVDLGGSLNIMNIKPDTVVILLLPPSFDEWQRRLTRRGEMETSEYWRRMETAVTIFTAAKKQPGFSIVISEDVHKSVDQINRLLDDGGPDATEQQRGQQLIDELSEQTEAHLQKRPPASN